MIDQNISHILAGEQHRQATELEMIASENYVSADVMSAYANIFTNKYSEGYPGARYYGGQKYVDELERLTQYRALRIFGLMWGAGDDESQENIIQALHDCTRSVNVQPLSGWPANAAVYIGFLRAWDTILAMNLAAGGHLSHGHVLNISGQNYTIVSYGVNATMDGLDYDDILQKALEAKPTMIVAGYSAFVGSIERARFVDVVEAVEKAHGYRPILMADIAHIAGLIAGGVLAWPFASFDIVTTTTHKTLRGPRGALIYMRKGLCTLQDGRVIDREKTVNRGVFPGLQWWPHMHVTVAKAVALHEILQSAFGDYAQAVVDNARMLAHELWLLGWPVLTGTTMNHMVLLDVTKRIVSGVEEQTGLTGKVAEYVLESVGISVNKNMLPNDKRTPMDPSGLRLGTPALTTRGMREAEVIQIANIIAQALNVAVKAKGEPISAGELSVLRAQVQLLCEKFPLQYGV